MKIRFSTPANRPPFFQTGDGEWFTDVTLNWGHQLVVETADVERLLAQAPAGGIVIARRLMGHERDAVLADLIGAQSETYATMLPSDVTRWQTEPDRRRRR